MKINHGIHVVATGQSTIVKKLYTKLHKKNRKRIENFMNRVKNNNLEKP